MTQLSDAEKGVAYYQAGHTQHKNGEWRKPPYVPSRVRIPLGACGDGPFRETYVEAGDYDCTSNKNGAVCVVATNGSKLGLRLDEFEVLEWRENS